MEEHVFLSRFVLLRFVGAAVGIQTYSGLRPILCDKFTTVVGPPGLSPERVRVRLRVRDCLDSHESRDHRYTLSYDRAVLMLIVSSPH